MKKTRPIYKKLLAAAFIVWVIGVSIFMIDVYLKLGKIEHAMAHMPFAQCAH